MRQSHFRCTALLLTVILAFNSQAQDVEPCAAFPGAFDNYEDFVFTKLDADGDLDDDGLPEQASLALIEAVACIDTTSDMNDATFNAYNMNLAVFDLEVDVNHLLPYRNTIALLMLIGADVQVQLNAALHGVLLGTYEIVQCDGAECTPDPIPEVDASVALITRSVVTRATNEPYSGSGNLDQDGTDNATEYSNVISQGGRTHDFVVAATSPNLNGTEEIRNPGGSSRGGCFVATAAYGTPLASEIDTLRIWRDGMLLDNALGTAFVDTYYRLSPALADVIATRPVLKNSARIVLYPVVWTLQFPALGLATILIALAFTGYFILKIFIKSTKRGVQR
ncbi:MAG: CFI-box-CTERM domain-containing protein [Candidatus Hydrogenedentota bacterium]